MHLGGDLGEGFPQGRRLQIPPIQAVGSDEKF